MRSVADAGSVELGMYEAVRDKVGNTGSENMLVSQGMTQIAGLPEAECEALTTDAAFCELIPLWSSLSEEAKQIILKIAKSRCS
ncbi:MAG: hypothetical protein AAGD07_22465 [Planctomycetota bacterium]